MSIEVVLTRCNGKMPRIFREYIPSDNGNTNGMPVLRIDTIKFCEIMKKNNACLRAQELGIRCWTRPDLASRIDEDMVDSPEDKKYMEDLSDD